MIRQPRENVAEIGLRIEAVELRRLDQGVHGSGTLATTVGAGEEPVLAADGNATQGALSGIVVERGGRRQSTA
jgi:hypothetical protein